MYKYLFLTAALLFQVLSHATVLKGKVTDENDMPLGFATILVKNTSLGTSANYSGDYFLHLPPGNYTIICQSVGYQSRTKDVRVSDNETVIHFKLIPQQLNLSEVTISAKREDPAYPIMRKVIAKRKYHAGLIQTFETDIYLKGALRTRSFPDNFLGIPLQSAGTKDAMEEVGLDSSGKGVVYLLEELSHYYYQSPNKTFNQVRSVRQSGDPKGLGFATMPPVINIYENNITILEGLNERGFISPANSNAFHYYTYKFLGSYIEGDRLINKIQISPKRKYEPLFSGYLYVVEEEWVFHSLDLLLTKEAQINTLDTLRFEQTYRPLAKDAWVIQSQLLYPTFKIIGIDFTGNFFTSYSNQQINHTLPEKIFDTKIIAVYDSLATDQITAYWDTIRPVPLETDEIDDYRFKDSMYVVQKAREDSLKNKAKLNYDFLLSGFQVNYKKSELRIRPLITAIQFNSVEGLSATLDLSYKYRHREKSTIKTQIINRYGFGNRHYNLLGKFGLKIDDPFWTGRYWDGELSGGRYIYQINAGRPISPIMNEIYTLFGGENHMKLFENQFLKLNLERNWGNGLKASVSIAYEQRIPLSNSTGFTFSKEHGNRLTSNQPPALKDLQKADAAIIAAVLSYQPNWHYIHYPSSKLPIKSNAPVLTASFTKGIPRILNSTSSFDKWMLAIKHQFHLRMAGNLQYHVETGGFLTKTMVNLPDYKHIDGNQTFWATRRAGSFLLAPYYTYSNTSDIYFESHAEWHLDGLLTNKIPLFRRLNWFLLSGNNTLYSDKNNYYTEVFVGLKNIGWKMMRWGRVDFVAGYANAQLKPSLGIRLSIMPTLFNLNRMQQEM